MNPEDDDFDVEEFLKTMKSKGNSGKGRSWFNKEEGSKKSKGTEGEVTHLVIAQRLETLAFLVKGGGPNSVSKKVEKILSGKEPTPDEFESTNQVLKTMIIPMAALSDVDPDEIETIIREYDPSSGKLMRNIDKESLEDLEEDMDERLSKIIQQATEDDPTLFQEM